jgi:hypothetical protein
MCRRVCVSVCVWKKESLSESIKVTDVSKLQHTQYWRLGLIKRLGTASTALPLDSFIPFWGRPRLNVMRLSSITTLDCFGSQQGKS